MSVIWVLICIFAFKKIIDVVYEAVKKVNSDFSKEKESEPSFEFELPTNDLFEEEPLNETIPESIPETPAYTPIDVVEVEGGRLELEKIDDSPHEEVEAQNHLLFVEGASQVELQKTLRKAIVMKEILEPKWQE